MKLGWGRRSLAAFILLVFLWGEATPVQAVRGIPGSADFGFGAILFTKGSSVNDALRMASDLSLDWISVPVSWRQVQRSVASELELKDLTPVMQYAQSQQIAVLINLIEAPDWAMTEHGPDPALSAAFLTAFYQQYPDAIQAVEIFPGANTKAAWGASPTASDYYKLFSVVRQAFLKIDPKLTLVAGGLKPLSANPSSEDINDLEFLRALGEAGAGSIMPVISVQLDELTGDPLQFPDRSEPRVLRHYEAVRQMMVANQMQKGVIWITRLSPPSGKISSKDSAYQDLNAQAVWLSQAYVQLRAQLYIGVTVGQSLNPVPEGMAAEVPSLMKKAGDLHPFYATLKEMIGLNQNESVSISPAMVKEGSFVRVRP